MIDYSLRCSIDRKGQKYDRPEAIEDHTGRCVAQFVFGTTESEMKAIELGMFLAQRRDVLIAALRNSIQDTVDVANLHDYEPGELEDSLGERIEVLRRLGGDVGGICGKNAYLLRIHCTNCLMDRDCAQKYPELRAGDIAVCCEVED